MCTKTWVRSSQYFIFMVASVAASSFVLFHAVRSLELLRMMLPRARVGNTEKANIEVGGREGRRKVEGGRRTEIERKRGREGGEG